MEYYFEKDRDFLYFRDVFFDYLRYINNPFYMCLTSLHDYQTEKATCAIGEAHYAVFLEELAKHPATDLSRQERESAREVFVEMNITVIKYEIQTQRNHHYWHETVKEVQSHVPLFPCTFTRDGPCDVSLPESYEPLLDRIYAFQEALILNDVDYLTDYLLSHFENLDRDWVYERLQFLSKYYTAASFVSTNQKYLQQPRRTNQ